jgi:uncharacterized protein (UPF0210 family)
MKIRAITCFLNVHRDLDTESIEATGLFARTARLAFERAGWEVQSLRLAIQPLSALFGPDETAAALTFAPTFERACRAAGFDYACLGPVVTTATPGLLEIVPDLVASTETLFASALVTSRQHSVDLAGVWNTARLIQRLSQVRTDGFGNLYFAALANCPPHVPFFPAAYHDGGLSRFGLAVETADTFVAAFADAASLDEARQRLVTAVENQAQRLEAVAWGLQRDHGFGFIGLDLSTATYPGEATSIAAAIERLTGLPVGQHGTLFAAAFITNALRGSRFSRGGFSGLMLPVLEDSVLAARYGQVSLTTTDLLLYSAVCGTGLDVVPLPGDVTVDQLAAMILDVAALAVALDKPLTVRLLPVPGKRAGDSTGFDFPYFANSTLVTPRAAPEARRLVQVCGVGLA